MSEEVEVPEVEQEQEQEVEQISPEQFKAMAAELERYKAKHAEQEKHVREAKKKAEQIERDKLAAERQKAEAEGNHQKLWETEKQRADRLEQELADRDGVIGTMRQKEIELMRDSHTSDIAAQEQADDAAGRSLKKLIREHVVVNDGKVEYQVDGVTIDKERFVKYIRDENPRLVKGSGATGGGAPGSKGGRASDGSNPKADEAKKKGDVNGFLAAHLNQ